MDGPMNADSDLRAEVARLPHLSASAISDYLRCPYLWWAIRVAKYPYQPIVNMQIGTAIHEGLAAYHRQEDAELALLAAWREHVTLPAPAGAIGRALEALDLYRQAVVPLSYDEAELLFRVRIPGVPIPLIGFYDLVRVSTEAPEEGEIFDYKTGNPRWGQPKIDSELQATAYIFGYQAELGVMPRKMVYHLFTTNSSPVTLRTLETTRTAEDMDTFVVLCQDVYRRMTTEEPTPRCPEGWCRFPEQCAVWKQEHGWEEAAPKQTVPELIVR
jgi:PD-(D/E)XK nuclease superfamily